jgi:hypothetical protein
MINNQKQIKFNEIKGIISEINIAEDYCSITLEVGHSNKRNVNLCCKAVYFENLIQNFKTGDKVNVHFYLASNKKNNRWYTTANLLNIFKEV